MANTVFKVENGLLVVGSANVSGSLTVGGEFNISGNITFAGTSNGDFRPINNNYSLGNTTNRWSLSAIDVDVFGNTSLSSTLFVSGQSTFYANVIPNANNIKLGDTNKRWDFYANNANVLTIGVGVITGANLTLSNTATVNGTLIVNPGIANAVVITGNSTHSNITFNSNSTQFFSNVIFDTNVLFVDATNNRVGITTLTPDAALAVNGTANVSGAVVFGSTLNVNSALTVTNSVSTSNSLAVGANVNLSTTSIIVGNTTVNSSITSSALFTSGTANVGNTNVAGVLTIAGNTVITNGKLTVNGDIITTGSLDSTSDARVKTNIRPITGALDTVVKLQGVIYDRTDNHQNNQMGLIAQQILPYVPEVVHGSNLNGYTVSYPNLVALLIEAVKDLEQKHKALEAEISSLRQ